MIETNRVEYKAKLTDSLEKEIVAFFNYKEGGIVYIGIDNDGNVLGLDNCDATQLKIKDTKNIFLRVNFSSTIGTGHIMRDI